MSPDTDDDLDDDLNDPLADEDDDFEDATGTAGSSEDFEDFHAPPVLCGLIRGHVVRAEYNKNKPKQLIIEMVSEEADSRGGKATGFLDLTQGWQIQRLRQLATFLGCRVEGLPGGGFRIHGEVKALTNKSGLFVIETYENKDGEIASSIAYREPKAKRSPGWAAYAAEKNFTAAQIKAIKANPGVINPKDRQLFE